MTGIPLVKPCPQCEDGTRWVSRYGGNDPDVWPVRCDNCDGTGEVTFLCDGRATGGVPCPEPATEEIDGEYYCTPHAAAARADAGDTSP